MLYEVGVIPPSRRSPVLQTKNKMLVLLAAVAVVVGCEVGMTDQERLQKAEALAAEGNLSAAVIEARSVLQDDPANVDARLALARYAMAAGDAPTAAKELGKAIELGADADAVRDDYLAALVEARMYADAVQLTEEGALSPEARVLRGRALLGAGRFDEAEIEFKAALERQPGLQEALVGLAELAVLRGQPEQATEQLGRIPEEARTTPRYHEVRGMAALSGGDFDEAVAAYKRALELSQPDPYGVRGFWLRGRLAEAWLAAGKVAEARREAEKLLAQAPRHPFSLYLMARIELQQGNPAEALRHAQALLGSQPNSLQARVIAGAASLALGNATQAESYVAPAVAANPGNALARRLLAQIRIALGQPQGAVDTLAPVMSETADPQLMDLYAVANVQAGRADSAAEMLLRRLEANPEDKALRIKTAYALIGAGRPSEAVSVLEQTEAGDALQLQRDMLLLRGYLADNEDEKARDLADRILGYSGESPARVGLVAAMFADTGRYDMAESLFQKVLASNPDSVAVMRSLGWLELARNDPEKARTWFDRAIELAPDDADVLMDRARLAQAEGDTARYVDLLERARSADGDALAPRLLLAQERVRSGDLKAAESLAREAVDVRPGDVAALNVLGVVLIGQDRPLDAETILLRAVQADPTEPVARLNLARAQVRAGKTEAARRSFREAIALAPDALVPRAVFAEFLLGLGELPQAEREISRLQADHPEAGSTRMLAADLAMRQGKYEAAETLYAELADDGGSRRAVMGLYYARSFLGKPDASEVLREWVAAHPTDGGAGVALAQALKRQGQDAAAIRQYEALLEQYPQSALVLNNLAWLYFETGDERAVEMARRAHELAPDSSAITDTLGWILFKRGETQRARELLEQAASQAPAEPEIQYHLAVALADTGDVQRAGEVARQILANPEAVDFHDEAQALLDRF